MLTYINRRLVALVPVLVGVSVIIFIIMRILPGDIALLYLGEEDAVSDKELAEIRHKLGTDRPIYEQYIKWITGVIKMDFGHSLYTERPVAAEIARTIPVSIELALLSMGLGILAGIPFGVLSAVRQNTWVDHVSRLIAIGGLSLPYFWIGILLLLGLSVFFRWMPPLFYMGPSEDLWVNIQMMILPSLAMGWHVSAPLLRMTRSCMLEVLREDYIRTAHAKGLQERIVLYRHALKNAVLPVI
ncbi:ABC transporter permease, partial [Thermodesulfobacteriota bacterium]